MFQNRRFAFLVVAFFAISAVLGTYLPEALANLPCHFCNTSLVNYVCANEYQQNGACPGSPQLCHGDNVTLYRCFLRVRSSCNMTNYCPGTCLYDSSITCNITGKGFHWGFSCR